AAIGRDKVCGEFLSPEVMDDFAALGCVDEMMGLAPIACRRLLVTTPRGSALRLTLEGRPAWALTRRAMETVLACRAGAEGVGVPERSPVRALAPDGGGWRWSIQGRDDWAGAIVAAFGKRSPLDARFALPRSAGAEAHAAAKVYFARPREALE